MTTTRPHATDAQDAQDAQGPQGMPASAHRRGPAKGVQSVKFSFFRLSDEAKRLPATERAALAERLGIRSDLGPVVVQLA